MSFIAPKEQRALITGASSGIGKATALAFAKAGIHLALVSRSADKLAAVAQAASEVGVKAQVYPLDLAEVDLVKEKISAIAADFGPIDILINSAGIAYTNPIADTSLADWLEILNLNLTSVFQCIQGILPGMRAQGGGTIVNVASVAAKQAFPNWGAYSVSKAGLMALAKNLSLEERSRGIRVTTIYPGAVDTALWDAKAVQGDFDRSLMLTPEAIAQAILQLTLMSEQALIEELILLPNGGNL